VPAGQLRARRRSFPQDIVIEDDRMPFQPVDPARLPPWKRKQPPGKSRSLSPHQQAAARARAAQAGRRYPNLVDNMWAARHVPRLEGDPIDALLHDATSNDELPHDRAQATPIDD
jgi:hypothetical protein